MERPKTYRDLVAWQKAHRLVLEVYRVTEVYPEHERFGLTSQTRRATVSVASNIAEGFSRRSLNHYLSHLDMSSTSLEETKYHLLLGRDLGYLSQQEYESLSGFADDVGRLLRRLSQSLERKL